MARSKRRNKATFKWTKELIILLSVIIVMIGVTIVLGIPSKADKLYEKYTSAQTSSQTALTEDNVFEEISFKKLAKRIKNDEYTYVYYGSITVTEFLDNIEAVNQAAQLYEIDKVYILESTWVQELDLEDEDDGKENQAKLDAREEQLDGVDMSIYPSLWIFKNGKVVFNSDDILNDDYFPAGWSFVIERAFANPLKEDLNA